jgi:serine protease Do
MIFLLASIYPMKLTHFLISLSFGLVTICFSQPAWAASEAEVREIARKITVKISEGGKGTGILIRKIGNKYTILTANHVIERSSKFKVFTPDGEPHDATKNYQELEKFKGYDLGILEFTSSKNYELAKIGDSSKMVIDRPVYAAGFPARNQKRKYDAPGSSIEGACHLFW